MTTETKQIEELRLARLAQRKKALVHANDIRFNRAQLKRELKAGRIQVYDLILKPPEWMETMKIFDLLVACPKYGRIKAQKILKLCRISFIATLGGLSERQRSEVVSRLRNG